MRSVFKAVIVIDAEVDPTWRDDVGRWLVESGCLYALAWGDSCVAWHDSVDAANIAAFEGDDIPDDAFVMTTWHDDEALAETFWFAGHSACHPTVELLATIIVHIAEVEREEALLADFEAAQTLVD